MQFVAQTEPLKVVLTCKIKKIKPVHKIKKIFVFFSTFLKLLFKPPALRIFVLGSRGAGKTTCGEWLAKQLDIFYIKFRELFQMMIIAKTREKITPADEVDLTTAESLAQVEGLIREARRASTLDDSAARMQVSIYKLSP